MQGGVYRPDVVRVGSEEAPLSQRARDVWVDGLIRHATHPDQDKGDIKKNLVTNL